MKAPNEFKEQRGSIFLTVEHEGRFLAKEIKSGCFREWLDSLPNKSAPMSASRNEAAFCGKTHFNTNYKIK